MGNTEIEAHLLTCTVSETHWSILACVVASVFVCIVNVSVETCVSTAPATGAETWVVLELVNECLGYRACTPSCSYENVSCVLVTWAEIYLEGIAVVITVIVGCCSEFQVKDYLLGNVASPTTIVVVFALISGLPCIGIAGRRIFCAGRHEEVCIVSL